MPGFPELSMKFQVFQECDFKTDNQIYILYFKTIKFQRKLPITYQVLFSNGLTVDIDRNSTSQVDERNISSICHH